MTFVIVGAGPTGVELAGALAELKNKILPKDFPDLDLRRMKIHLVEAADRVLAAMEEKSSEKAHAYLKKLGVHVWTKTFVEDYKDGLVETNGQDFEAETLVWGKQGLKAISHPEFIKIILARAIGSLSMSFVR